MRYFTAPFALIWGDWRLSAFFRLTAWAYAGENDIVGQQHKAVGVPDAFLQMLKIGDSDIKYPSALLAAHMIVPPGIEVEAVGGVGNLDAQNIALICQQVQIAVDRSLADAGVMFGNVAVNLLRRRMIGHRPNGFQNKLPLNGIS